MDDVLLVIYLVQVQRSEMTVGTFPERSSHNGVPRLADIPAAGTNIRTGEPICTVLAEGASIDDCRDALNDRALEMLRRFRE